ITTLNYDGEGNLTEKKQGSDSTIYRYNGNDNLISVARNGTTLGRYSNDHLGLRIEKEAKDPLQPGAPPVKLRTLWDGRNAFQDRDSGGEVVARYDNDGRHPVGMWHRDDGSQALHRDALGSIVATTDGSGKLKSEIVYDAFGNITEATGQSANKFGYTGHQMDAETGLIYFQARYYDPQLGRFITQDPYEGDWKTPLSLHHYLYAYANPTVYVDLNGYKSVNPFMVDPALSPTEREAFGVAPGGVPGVTAAPIPMPFCVPGGCIIVPAPAPVPGPPAPSFTGSVRGWMADKVRTGFEAPAVPVQAKPQLSKEEGAYYQEMARRHFAKLDAEKAAEENAKLAAAPRVVEEGRDGKLATSPVITGAPIKPPKRGVNIIGTPQDGHRANFAHDRPVEEKDRDAGLLVNPEDRHEGNRVIGTPVGGHTGLGIIARSQDVGFKRWKPGDAIDKPLRDGSKPDWDTVRGRYWKNRYKAVKDSNSLEFTEANMRRMQKGTAPQDYNIYTGKFESRELHHHDPQRDQGSNGPRNLREVTPDQHRKLDPYRK
ncbi:RHS repeat domain-containing protein, partial [Duganella sp. Root336D2]|uniref:RHS repeat domain-containing protein n=1 Tax=Duganella sp. Root336D2 TaxID=1736518 RepID=UPI000B12F5EB